MTTAWYTSQYASDYAVSAVGGRRRHLSASFPKPLGLGLIRSATDVGPICAFALLDPTMTDGGRIVASLTSTLERSTLLPFNSPGLSSESNASCNNAIDGYSREPDGYGIAKQRTRQSHPKQRAVNGTRRSVSIDLIAPDLSVCSKEFAERKTNATNGRLLRKVPNDSRPKQTTTSDDLSCNILRGIQMISPLSGSSDKEVVLERIGTQSLASSSNSNSNDMQKQQQQQQLIGETTDNYILGCCTKIQMPHLLSKRLQARSSITATNNGSSSSSSCMPGTKTLQKTVDQLYVDPMVNCSLRFHERVAELIVMETETIRWEKARKMKKRAKDKLDNS